MNRSDVYRPWTGRERNSGELFVELGAELTINEAMRRAALGLSFDLPDADGMASDDDFESEDPTNVIGIDVDQMFEMNRDAKEYEKVLREDRKKQKKVAADRRASAEKDARDAHVKAVADALKNPKLSETEP